MMDTELNEVYILAYTAPGLCFSCLQFTPEICFTAKKSVSFQCTARPMKLDVLFDVVGLSMDELERLAWQLCHLHGVSRLQHSD